MEASQHEPRRVGLLSVHTSPLDQPGQGDSGGMNVYLRALAARLAAAGVQVDCFTRAAGDDAPPTVDTGDGVRVHHLPAGPAGLGKEELANHLCAFYLSFAAHPARPGLDLVHCHYWMSGWAGRLARRRLGLPLVQSFHTLARTKNDALAPGDQPEPALRTTAEERVVADADAVVASTPGEARMLRERYGARPGQVRVVPPGVDLDVFHPAPGGEPPRSPGDGPTILFVGRLQPLKGPDVAVRALARLADLLPDAPPARLVVVGGASGRNRGAAPASLRALARRLGVERRVDLLPPRPPRQLAALYRAADVVVVPSRSESFGLVALEAQACRTPVVAADVGGLAHVLREGGGTLVAGHDPDAYAAAIARYLCDPRAAGAAGAAGRRNALRHGWGRTAEATLGLYRTVLARWAADAPATAAGWPTADLRGA